MVLNARSGGPECPPLRDCGRMGPTKAEAKFTISPNGAAAPEIANGDEPSSVRAPPQPSPAAQSGRTIEGVTGAPMGWDVGSPVQAEILVLSLNNDQIELTGPCGAAPWIVELGTADDPMELVERIVRDVVGQPRCSTQPLGGGTTTR